MTRLRRTFSRGWVLALATVAACSGGGSDPSPPPAQTYAISGTITGAAAVTVTLSGAAAASTTTDASGNFTFTGLANGSYVVTPSKAGFAFSPVSTAVTVNGANVPGTSFTATAAPVTYSIAGTVTGATGVTVTLSGPASGTVTTSGAFSFAAVAPGTYTVTPSKAGYTFTPPSAQVTLTGANVSNVDFAAAPVTYAISGRVTGVAGATLTLSGAASKTETADASGDYAFSGLLPGTYTVTPSKAGFVFAPSSAAVVITDASVGGKDFAASVATYTVSGTVVGAATSGVTVSLSGDASLATTTDGSGVYAFSGLANGAYTVTPSLTGYDFTPLTRNVTVSGADVAVAAFTSSVETVPTFTLSGAISGPWVDGVTVTLGGDATRTVTTGATGAYSFPGLPAGSYTVTPSLAGYAFTPASATVALSANASEDFTQASAIASFSISGTVSYAGSKPGRIFVDARPCPTCSATASASMEQTGAATAYMLRGLGAGTYYVHAWIDNLGSGQPNATNPRGTSAAASAGASSVVVTVSDPANPALQAPTEVMAFPGDRSALVLWEPPQTADWIEAATGYKVYWGTDAAASVGGGVATVGARDDTHFIVTGLTNGTAYYFKVTALLDGVGESAASAPFGPITINPGTGGRTVSGTVTFPGTATGPLYVILINEDQGQFFFARVGSPVSPQAYSLAGVPDGAYYTFVLLDQNASGAIDTGDLAEEAGDLQIAGNSALNVTLTGDAAQVVARTEHWKSGGSEGYQLNLRVVGNTKRPVAVTLVSGPNVAVPTDLPLDWEFQLWASLAARPAVGDAYTLVVTYSDGTKETRVAPVTGVLDAFPRNLAVNAGAPYSAAAPLFTWQAPLSPPASYTYSLQVWGPSAWWWYPDSDVGLPSTTLSARYNANGEAYPAALVSGQTYGWSVAVRDGNGNSARQDAAQYTVP